MSSTQDLAVAPNPVVGTLKPYSPGRLRYPIDLRLDANEALAPAPGMAAALSSAAELNRYPERGELEAQIAALHGVAPEQVLVTAGADDALERAIRAVCAPGRQAILTAPSFEMLSRYARLAGAAVTELEWWRDDWPVDAALAAASERTAVVTVVSPNNPTGAVVSRATLERLATALPQALILLDHAYAEFARKDLTRSALAFPNVVVFRTFSKAWGAAGLRVGYAVGDARVLGWMRAVGQPYAVAAPSLAAAGRLLELAPEPPPPALDRVLRQRSRLAELLAELGAETLPSQGNFVLTRPRDAQWLRTGLAALGIGIRAFAGHRLLADWVRITVPGDDLAWQRLEAGLRTVLAPEALLLDMDGVLADVSGSYRRAIVETAASFGVEISAGDIGRAKAAGDAANDWLLTRRLLAEAGVDAELATVTDRFEALYQGAAGRPGLYRQERPRFARETLERLAAARPLAVVTGRPRADAERFLAEQGLDGLFATVVTMEDAAPKPDPAPVRLALERLGARHAWMLGDTPDDVRAARGAGVLPLAVPAPGEDRGACRAVLLAAGAAAVFDRPDDLEELLS